MNRCCSRKGVGCCTGVLLLAAFSASALTEFDADSIVGVMKRLAKYRMGSSYSQIQNTWWGGTYMSGIMALYRASKDETYLTYAKNWSASKGWKGNDAPRSAGELITNPLWNHPHADCQCPYQVYSEIYLLDPRPANDFMIAPTRSDLVTIFDVIKPDPVKLWWWCDAIYMILPSITRFAKASPPESRFIDTMNAYFWKVSNALYDSRYHLWYRDQSYISQKSINGKPVFWAPGEAWVIGGLARMLEYMPADHKNRAAFVQQFTDMCAAIKACQGGNAQFKGLWTTSMLDAPDYPDPETSGTAFFCFAFAWGVRNGLLAEADYHASIDSAWKNLVRCVGPDGRLQRCQKVDWEPRTSLGDYINNSSPEGEGAFLLAGSEMYLRAIQSGAKDTKPAVPLSRNSFFILKENGIFLAVSGESRITVSLYDIQGKRAYETTKLLRKNSGTLFLPLNNLSLHSGPYLGIIKSGLTQKAGLVVLQK